MMDPEIIRLKLGNVFMAVDARSKNVNYADQMFLLLGLGVMMKDEMCKHDLTVISVASLERFRAVVRAFNDARVWPVAGTEDRYMRLLDAADAITAEDMGE